MTIPETIARHAAHAPERSAVVFITEDGVQQLVTAGELHRQAEHHARVLQTLGVEPGDLVVIALRYSWSLVATFNGATYLGAVPSIFAYLTDKQDLAIYAQRVAALVAASSARVVICVPEVARIIATLVAVGKCRVLSSADIASIAPPDSQALPTRRGADELVLVQYTSGTTGQQKGVALSHRQVLDFVDAFVASLGVTPSDVFVSWLPLNHDMGLFTGLLLPVLTGVQLVIMSPTYWIRNPVTLLQAVHDFRGTLCWMPNFAFKHCVRRIRDSELAGIDLSSWRVLTNAAEPVRRDAVESFGQRFAPSGLRRGTVRAAYGMAEIVLLATSTPGDGPPRVDWVQGSELRGQQRAVPTQPEAAGALALVSCGRPLPGTDLAIVDESDRALPERQIGEIALRNHYVARGYHQRPGADTQTMRDGWLYTGDIGYCADGELYICGRKSDMIIVAGSNIYPGEVETITDSMPEVHPGRAVAFGVRDDERGTERIVLLCELHQSLTDEEIRRLDRALRRLTLQQLDVTLGDVRFVAKDWIIKTTSGKLARRANRDKYLQIFATPSTTT
ncbi:MAG: AMP-binding protein [Deltaproteobacteria bacterium]|nr:AMP-binding protein [Deltaproteobacteria bacterium]MBI3388984.1 AMP-binding protein [Deltaproteobacteria bacterium]